MIHIGGGDGGGMCVYMYIYIHTHYFSAKRRAYFCKSVAIEMGGGCIMILFSSTGVRGRFDSPVSVK